MTFDTDPHGNSLTSFICCVVGGLVTGTPEGARIGKHVGKLIGNLLF